MSKTILMFGWEFPPNNHGGLGVACEGLINGLIVKGTKITLVLPGVYKSSHNNECKIISCDTETFLKTKKITSLLTPYCTAESYLRKMNTHGDGYKALYGTNIFEEVWRYSKIAKGIVLSESFDIIHAHDWMTFPAGIEAKKISKKPLIVHVHATEFDRTGGNGVNQEVYNIEKEGMHQADKVIAVSNFTKQKIVYHYGIDPNKVVVLHNAISNKHYHKDYHYLKKEGPIVLFLGRITLQKGPDYFVETAKMVLEHKPNTTFVIAGSGDMESSIIERVAHLGIADNVLFTGFLRGEKLKQIYHMADIYVMPSVSEPFGLTPLEAMASGTPSLISKQAGVSEIINHCLKVDFWDVNQIASHIISALEHPELLSELSRNGKNEVAKLDWGKTAEKCMQIYETV